MIRTAILPLLLLTAACAEPDPALQGRASVIDGDTLEIHGQRIRLWGVDAPERRQTCRQAGRDIACGRVFANRLDQYINGRPLTCFAQDEDRFGRIISWARVA